MAKFLQITRNNENISGKTFRESESILATHLSDVSFELLSTIIILSQGMPNKLSAFTPSGRKELLEKLTKSDFMIEDTKNRVATRQTFLNTLKVDLEKQLLLRTQSLTQLQGTLDTLNFQLKNWKTPDYTTELTASLQKQKDLATKIEVLTTKIALCEKQVEELNKTYIKLTSEQTAEYTCLNEEYTKATTTDTGAKLELEYKIKNLSTEITKLKAITDICPTCGQKLKNVQKPDTTEKEAELKQLQEDLEKKTKELFTKNGKYTEYKSKLEAKFTANMAAVTEKLAIEKQSLAQFKQLHTTYLAQKAIEETAYAKLQYDQQNIEAKLMELHNSIDKTTKEITKVTKEKLATTTKLTDIETHIEVVKKIETLTKRDFRGYLLSNIIKYIDKKAKDYCELVFKNRDLTITLNGNNLDILYGNKLFDNLSGGEKQKCDLIIQFAIRDLLQKYLNINSNILVLDEVTDFLDKASCRAIIDLITKELKEVESVFIISHHIEELELPIDTELHVLKNSEGVSAIV